MSTYYLGSTESWEDYLKAVSQFKEIKAEIRKTSKAERIAISKQTQEIIASKEALIKKFGEGFDALNGTLDRGFGRLEKVIRETKGSIEDLRASFDYNMALMLEQMQLQNETSLRILNKLDDIHATLQNPLLTQARELFRIGCERLIKGLLDKALEAFLASAEKDETNFMTQLLIGKLYLYGVNQECNVIDLARAMEHLNAAARYARAESRLLPEASRYAGEAHLHAAISYYAQANMYLRNGNHQDAQRMLRKAYDAAREASDVYPQLSEGHYHQAKFAALLGDGKTASQSLEKAIVQDEVYCLKADADQDFNHVRKDVGQLFQQLRDKSKYKIQQRLYHAERILSDWHFPTIEAKNVKAEIQQFLDEAESCLARNTYFDNQEALRLIQQAEQLFQSLLVHKFSLHTLSAHSGRISCMAFNSTQTLFASGGADKQVHIWKLAENQLLFMLSGHEEMITDLVFSHDGQALASVDKKGRIKVWNVNDGTLVYDFSAQTEAVHCLAFSPDDAILAAGCYNRVALLWSMDDGTLLHTLNGHKSSVDTLVFSNNGQYVATGSPDNTAVLWNVEDGRLLHTFYGCSGLKHSLAFSPDDRNLIIGSNDGSVHFFDVRDASMVHSLPDRSGVISWIALSPDCKKLATINYGKAIQLWDIESGKLLHNLRPYSQGISSVRFSPDGSILAASDFQDHSVKLWNVQSGQIMHVIAGNLTCSTFSPDGTKLATGDEGGSIKFWGRMIKPLNTTLPARSKAVRRHRSWKRRDEIFEIRERRKKKNTGNHRPLHAQTPAPTPVQERREHAGIPPVEAEKPKRPARESHRSPIFQSKKTREKEELSDQLIQERIQKGQCWVCGRKLGILAKLAGIRLCHKHYFRF